MLNYLPWIEKYKPKTFEDFGYHIDIINTIKNNIDNLPNMIFSGPPGCGKTTLINIICDLIYKDSKKTKKKNCLFLNASDERGITDVKNKIKNFCMKTPYNHDFKIIILDEADAITYEAQTALRKIMENYSKTTRFCFLCNYDNKIINPIISRCIKFNFTKLSNQYIKYFLNLVLEKENIKTKDYYIDNITKYTNGDLRKSLIILETITKVKHILSENEVKKILGIIRDDEIYFFLNKIKEDNIVKLSQQVLANSYPIKLFIEKYTEIILKDNTVINKYKIINSLTKYDNMIFNNIDKTLIIINIFNDYYNFNLKNQ